MSSILNVGYGTTNPKKLIHLVQNNVALRVQDARTTGDRTAGVEFMNGNGDVFSSNNFETDWRIINSNALFCIQSGTSNITNNVMNFTTAGYVGIGTRQPRSTLDVVGNMTIDGNIVPGINSNYNLGSLENKWKDLYLSGNSIFLNDTVISSDAGSNLNIKDISGVYKNMNINTLQLNNSGKQIVLGLDESGRLTYTNASNITSYAITTTSVASANLDSSILAVDKGGTGVGTFASGQLLIGNGTSNVYQNANLKWDNANGRLGIGTANPSQRVHIVHPTNSLVRIETDTTSASQVSGIEFGVPAFSSDTRSKITSTTYDGDASDLQFYTSSATSSSTSRMMITSNGNVGIGTLTNLSNRLNVDGTVSATLFYGTGSNLIDIPISGITDLQITLDTNATNASNYILSTSNIISKRITDLRTDMITENLDASNKFIVNNIYNDDLTLNGSLTIHSNLIVLGDTTQLDTVVYTTERLEIINANNTSTALMVQQNTADRDIFIASNINTAVFRIANNGDVHIHGSGNGDNAGVYKRNNRDVILDTSNYIRTTSNNLINYVLASSNTLINKANFNDTNTSNYILSTSNNLINYVLASSNTLINKANFNDTNTSNYILSTSNNLINYVLASSNTLINKANFNDTNTSNYILSTSNNLINYVLTSSNTLINKANFNDANSSNYILSTSNIISKRITDLTTDMITENLDASNKFIINNLYNNNLEVNGSLTINSNLIVLGDTTQLETIVYTTERLEIVNTNNTSTALMVQQNTADRDIFVASNMNTAVFKIANNGDVHINGEGVYKRNNRDVIYDSSNYILSTSNNLINYVLTSSNTLINKANFNDVNSSNYILSTSNNLINYVLTSSNTLINKANFNDANTSNYILSTSNNLINYVLTSSNTLINKANFNDTNSSNYILSTSNNLSKRITDLRTDMITENLDASNKFIVNNLYNDDLTLNGSLTINSNLIVHGDTTQLNTIVYTTERLEIVNANNTSTALMVQQNTADRDIFVASNMNTAVFKIANNGDLLINGTGNYKKNNRDVILDTSNYILSTSNNLINYVLTSSNTLINKANFNDTNTSNYILSTSNNLIN